MQFEEDDLIMNEKKLKLSDDMDSCMIDTLLEQKLKGQKIGGNFTKTACRATTMAVSKYV